MAGVVVVSLALLFWIALRWYHPGEEIASVDYIPEYAPLIAFEKTFFAWNETTSPFGGFGSPVFATYFLFFGALAIFGVGFAQTLFSWLLMATAWIGMYSLSRGLTLRPLAAFMAAWTYTLSPVAQFLPTFTTGFEFFAALPWVLWSAHRSAVHASSRRTVAAILIAASFLVLPWIAATPQLFFELVLVATAWCIFLLPRATRGFFAWVLVTASTCVIAASWWLVPVFFALFGNQVTKTSMIENPAFAFANSSLLNNLRFIPQWFWSYPNIIPYARGYDHNIAVYTAGFWSAIVICIGLLLAKRLKYASYTRFFAGLFVVGLFITKGAHSPLQQINSLIYHVPGFFLLQEPAGTMIASLLAACVVLAIVMDHATSLAREKIFARAGLAALVAASTAAALLVSSPLLNALVFSGANDYVSLPHYWRQASAYINAAGGDGWVLVLPRDRHYQAIYDWGFRAMDGVPVELIERAVLLTGPTWDYVTDPRLEALKRNIDGMLLT
ncbi:MAG: DUF3367 domain-containing protein, partial [Candidatus Eremiobacteraeota bacterium]|nr:DUF3367 domain-containing protein [Candidatus Eremiobacteraeota bacterium]